MAREPRSARSYIRERMSSRLSKSRTERMSPRLSAPRALNRYRLGAARPGRREATSFRERKGRGPRGSSLKSGRFRVTNESSKVVQPRVPVAGRADRFLPRLQRMHPRACNNLFRLAANLAFCVVPSRLRAFSKNRVLKPWGRANGAGPSARRSSTVRRIQRICFPPRAWLFFEEKARRHQGTT